MYYAHHVKGDRYGYLYCHGKRVPFLKRWIGTGKKVLDLGCRDGCLTEHYAAGNVITGVDIDQHALALAEKKFSLKTHWLDLNTEWPFRANEFDVIIACEILEHIFHWDFLLKNIESSLKENGLFIGSVPNSFRLRNRMKFLLGKEYETDPTHVRQFSYTKLYKMLATSFTNIEIIPLEGTFFPFCRVSANTPRRISHLFAKDFLWRSLKRGKGFGAEGTI